MGTWLGGASGAHGRGLNSEEMGLINNHRLDVDDKIDSVSELVWKHHDTSVSGREKPWFSCGFFPPIHWLKWFVPACHMFFGEYELQVQLFCLLLTTSKV